MRPFIFLTLYAMSHFALSQERGFKRIALDTSDRSDFLYKENHALIIGNSKYVNGWPNLSGVAEDVIEVGKALESRGFNVVQAENLDKFQLDSAITQFISQYGTNLQAGLLFYFAGHGHTIETNYGEKLGYIVPVSAPDPNVEPMDFQSNATEMAQMEIYAKRIESKHAIFIFDACFSGSLFSASRAIPEVISYKTTQPVRQFISSGTEDEKVSDESIFRKQFVEAMTTGNADFNDDGYLTGTELGRFLQSTVINYTNGSQHPQYGKISNPALSKGDFVFALDSVLRLSGNKSGADVGMSPEERIPRIGSIELTTEIGGDLYIDGNLLASITANSIVPIQGISLGEHMLEIRGSTPGKEVVTVLDKVPVRAKMVNPTNTNIDLPFIQMVYVQGGTFEMGGESGDTDEVPVHSVTLNDFEISSFEITISQFRKFVKETNYRTEAEVEGWAWIFDGEWKKKSGYNWQMNAKGEKAGEREPVTFVSWNDCQKFTEWISEKFNGRFRLPTEAEWEYAARGGVHAGTGQFSGGELAPFLGWFETNTRGSAQSVGGQKTNELNLHDMSGNVWEWCADWYGVAYYARSSTSNPKGELNSEYRVMRGGSWNNNEASGRITNRHKNRPNERDSFTGFRVVRETF